jgi:hypothetical protein
MNWKGCARMWLWPISRHSPGSSKENHKYSVRIVGELTDTNLAPPKYKSELLLPYPVS